MKHSAESPPTGAAPWRERAHQVVFEADTTAGRVFDLTVLAAIAASVAVVSLESVASIQARWSAELRVAEWVFTAFFTVEYLLRLAVVKSPLAYARSFYGLVDLVAVLPSYLSLVFPGAQALLAVRALRFLRVFRVLKATRYVGEMTVLTRALRASRPKIVVFLFVVLTLVLVMGTLVYLVEGAANGFTSIPRAVYWAIVTMTTVGYGDVAPQTPLGQLIAAAAMVLGYSLIVIPTGIFANELARRRDVSTQHCRSCAREGHDTDAVHCKYCGERL
jgi:voltage-gated potassium channel